MEMTPFDDACGKYLFSKMSVYIVANRFYASRCVRTRYIKFVDFVFAYKIGKFFSCKRVAFRLCKNIIRYDSHFRKKPKRYYSGIKVNSEKCIACSLCASICPMKNFGIVGKTIDIVKYRKVSLTFPQLSYLFASPTSRADALPLL